MKTKQKWAVSLLLFGIGGILNLFISTALHRLLSGYTSRLTWPTLESCLSSLISNSQHVLLFVCLQGFILLLTVLFFTTNNRPYQSKLQRVAPGIETPISTGQHQHGSARWLKEEEWPRAFDHYSLDLRHPLIRHLIDSGYDDLNFLKPSKQEDMHDEAASSENDPQT